METFPYGGYLGSGFCQEAHQHQIWHAWQKLYRHFILHPGRHKLNGRGPCCVHVRAGPAAPKLAPRTHPDLLLLFYPLPSKGALLKGPHCSLESCNPDSSLTLPDLPSNGWHELLKAFPSPQAEPSDCCRWGGGHFARCPQFLMTTMAWCRTAVLSPPPSCQELNPVCY